jgi:hypothetical protein
MFVVISELDAVAAPRAFYGFISRIYPDVWAPECNKNAGAHVGTVLISGELNAQSIIKNCINRSC